MRQWTDALSASLWGERLRQARARALTLWVLSGITPLSIIGDGVSDTCLSAVHVALVSVSVHAYTLGRERPARHVGRVHSDTILYTVLEWSMGEALCTSVALELLADMYAIYVCRAPEVCPTHGPTWGRLRSSEAREVYLTPPHAQSSVYGSWHIRS